MSSPDPRHDNGLREATQRKLSLLQTVKAVAWSFVGMRRGADYQNDVSKLNPVHVIIAGVLMALAFIAALMMLVSWIVGSGAAT
ncbi:MAG: DUF2970 domain-containing protein [Leptothrix sp. (in: b-proteobacteria)]